MTAPADEPNVRAIIIAHDGLWESLTQWADHNGLRLVAMPSELSGDDDIPSYFFTPKEWPAP
jgi:hypothetical protein